ncbi:acylneuraminate cytidylyltransferase family protein [Mesorhizobium sp. DCY119]|uniref:acylneuraminate cytidylyltransferase family protein n=1 Tax=Mesorhizobium sp. DCY119 TaxID=2108445 RepID=UPI000E74BF53|nr:acylneuraminate cytidylyltransferase family protein [Mesorhizobium sp. DCY119]RJG40889.1 acylneuraminate cytidylyltransferase family protein [Mesorhizobium sp. DCY119]
MHKLVALMPMRHSSERVKGKNYRPFGNGKALFEHMLQVLLECREIDKIAIDTDSPNIREICERDYPDVLIIDRPDHLCDGSIPMNEILLHDVAQVPSQFYLQTHSTNPLLKADTVRDAISTFLDNYPMHDSLFSVTRRQTRYWDELARPINHNRDILLRTQDLPPVYEENSCIYIFEGEGLLRRYNRIGNRPYLFEIEERQAADIDEEINFEIAELMFKRMHQLP